MISCTGHKDRIRHNLLLRFRPEAADIVFPDLISLLRSGLFFCLEEEK